MARKYASTIQTPEGPRKCFEATITGSRGKPLVARFGGVPLKRQKNAVLIDREVIPTYRRGKQLIGRLLAGKCEVCGQTEGVDVHHIDKLADLERSRHPLPAWAQLMVRRRRKTLVVCPTCHTTIHASQPAA